MKIAGLALIALGLCLALPPACTTASAPAAGGQLDSVQVLYRSSGFPGSESFSSLALVLEKQTAPGGERFVLVATFGYNDTPHPDSVVIAADGQAAALRDGHPRTARRLLGAPRFTTRLTLPLGRQLVACLASAGRIVVEGGGQRITLTDRERAILQALLAGPPSAG